LWHYTFPHAGSQSRQLLAGTVLDGQVRIIKLHPHPVEMITFDVAGKITGHQGLPMFDRGGFPRLIGGDYGTLIVSDENRKPDSARPPYMLLAATH
jgi:hypothetical protein